MGKWRVRYDYRFRCPVCKKEYKFVSHFCDHILNKHPDWAEKNMFNINDLWDAPINILRANDKMENVE